MSRLRGSIVWQLVLPVPVILIAAILAIWITVPRIVAENAYDSAVLSATRTANQFMLLRSYYTKNVAEKVLKDGNLRLSPNHKNEPNSIPLPATLIHDLSALLEKEQTVIKLYSAFPFPNRSTRILDDFQREAWDGLVGTPDQVFTRQETRDGVEVVRVAIADVMVTETCVGCHNSYPSTPKADWEIGDVRGVLEVDVAIGEQLAAGAHLGNTIILAAVLGGSLLIGICTVAARRVTTPLIRMTHAMDRLSEGHTDTDIPDRQRVDEVGVMARSLEVFKDHVVRIRQSKADLEKEIRHRETYEEKLRVAQQELEERVTERTQELSEEAARRRQTQDQLSEAIENMSEGFAIYDADDRLVLCNSKNREFYTESADLFVTGTHIEDIIRAGVERGQYVDTTGDTEDWITWRLDRFRNPSGVFVEKLGSGKWIQISEHKTKDRRTVCVRTDITEQKVRETVLRENETKIRSILDNTAECIITIDEKGLVETFNREAERCFGYEASEIVGRNVTTLMTDPDAVHHGGYLKRFLNDGQRNVIGVRREVTGQRKNNTIFPAELAVGEVRVGDRHMFVGILKDISERKRTEAALIGSQQRLRAITDNLFEGVLVVDLDGHIVFANRSAETLLGSQGGKLAGRDLDDIFVLRRENGDIHFAKSPFHRVGTTGAIERDDDATFVTSDGKILDIAFGCLPLLENSKRLGAIISFRDIHELKDAQNETLQASRLASVGQLAAGIAHEINTPAQYIGDNLRFLSKAHEDIATILNAYAELAQAARSSRALSEMVAKVDAAMEEGDLEYLLDEIPSATEQSLGGIDQVSRIVLAMKEFSHPGTGDKTATDLNLALENTLTVCRNEWKDIAEADVRLDPALPLVSCLPGQMNQVFLNLIVNAAHAIAEVGAEAGAEVGADGLGRITVETRQDGDCVEIRIADTGGGIPEEIRNRVFDPFFTTKEVGKGTGQGLAICRDIVVDKHGGKISIEPGQDMGTVFVISIPIAGQSQESEAA